MSAAPGTRPRPAAGRLAPALALAVALAPCAARAADDGGTRSVFAAGAGNRALAMGSAFGALADDASALLWNPGGLGRVARTEVQFAQAALNDLGFRETFVGAVHPDWRWGAAALALRQYGVDGIDGRDERNLPTGELSDRETELVLGYGRALGEAASVGFAGRVRRQDLAGRSGTGVGADAGATLDPARLLGLEGGWLEGVRAGLAIQNLVEPAIRLDRESVPDPLTVRAGLSVARPLAAGAARLALDLEKPRDVGVRLHAGLEVAAHPLLALRGGIDGSTLTAGAGLAFGPAAFDYAFADLPTGPSHRAGLTWRFGRSVEDSRLLAARAEEERLQQRLTALERERRADRIANLMAGAEAARAAGRPEEALEALATLLAIDSTDVSARRLRAACLADRARALEAAEDWAEASVVWARALAESPGDTAAASGLARSRAESDQRALRSAEIRQALAAALDAFAADDLAGARAGLQAILARQPRDAEAQAMLRRVEAAVARRTGGWLRQADVLTQAGSLPEARALIERARALDARALGLAAATGALARAEQSRDAARVAERAAPPATRPAAPRLALTREQERRAAVLYRLGLDALEHGRSDEALRALEQVRALRPGYARVDQLLLREYLTRGMELFSAGRLDAAVRLWESALQVDPHDPRALGYLARAHEQLARSREISQDVP
jgi:tetratricopeptide (TPR) repeat protein